MTDKTVHVFKEAGVKNVLTQPSHCYFCREVNRNYVAADQSLTLSPSLSLSVCLSSPFSFPLSLDIFLS